DRRVTRRLWRVARLVERRLAALASGAEAVFAHVPSEAYHLTIVNRTHYGEDAKVSALSREEAEEARRIVRRQSRGALALQFHGLIVSRAGLLLAPGYPANDDFYDLRARLAQEMPVLQKHLPGMAHLKLGHVLVPLAGGPLHELLCWLRACGELVNARLVFHDLYTPHGRIEL
ncbi:MAG TPA: hypothetical protein VOA87_22380, partial [Thermoanaerobaculia bacterium]|nr:hypothetical protein [Thermoanaerobaculia bacterium]